MPYSCHNICFVMTAGADITFLRPRGGGADLVGVNFGTPEGVRRSRAGGSKRGVQDTNLANSMEPQAEVGSSWPKGSNKREHHGIPQGFPP